jgi:hypothetical protein
MEELGIGRDDRSTAVDAVPRVHTAANNTDSATVQVR